jgi:surface carbohydrate biosynthesis protein
MPPQSKIVIIDDLMPDAFRSMLNEGGIDHQILHVRFERVYVPILVIALFKKLFSKRKLFFEYMCHFVLSTKAEWCGTTRDLDPRIWKLKQMLPGLRVFIIQHGWRGRGVPIDENPDIRSEIDFGFLWGSSSALTYKQHLKILNEVVVGSVKNNAVPVVWEKKPCFSVGYVSDFENDPYYDRQIIANLQVLSAICKDMAVNLRVLARHRKNTLEAAAEVCFYESVLGEAFIYVPQECEETTYRESDQCHLVVGNCSSMLYEIASRGVSPVAIVNSYASGTGRDDLTFGWPVGLPISGDGYTNDPDPNAVARVIHGALMNPEKNIRALKSLSMMEFNAGNSRLREFLSEIAVPD